MHPPLGRFRLDHTFYGRIAGGLRGTLLVNSLYLRMSQDGRGANCNSLGTGQQGVKVYWYWCSRDGTWEEERLLGQF